MFVRCSNLRRIRLTYAEFGEETGRSPGGGSGSPPVHANANTAVFPHKLLQYWQPRAAASPLRHLANNCGWLTHAGHSLYFSVG